MLKPTRRRNPAEGGYLLVLWIFLFFVLMGLQGVAVASPPLHASGSHRGGAAKSQKITVTSHLELKKSLQKSLPGTVISIAPGHYGRGIYLKNIHGTPDQPIIIRAANPENPPVFQGLGEGAKLSNCSYVKLSNLIFKGFPKNGVNVDDGGNIATPSHHIVLENLVVREIGPKGNHDAIKMSGVRHFVVRGCRLEKWGGSGLDLVGCQNGLVEDCRFNGGEGFRSANGVQIKGGSRDILVQISVFRNVKERVVNIGGMTGLQYFRPAVLGYEARDITIAGNTVIGGEAHIAWVTSRNSHVHHNLFYQPEKWVGRILQETKDPQFAPCKKGLFENNLIVTNKRVRSAFNIGRGTDPATFVFRNNAWFQPGVDSKPSLPTPENGGVYGLDPMLVEAGEAGFVSTSTEPSLRQVGPWAYEPLVLNKEFGDVETFSSVVVPAPPPAAPEKVSWLLAGSLGLAGLLAFIFLWYRALNWFFSRGEPR